MIIIKFEQPALFISSTGRTGTQFLAQALGKMIEDCTAVHEPGTPWITRPQEWLAEIKQFGLYHMTLGQLQSDCCMYKLSTERCSNRLSKEEVMEKIIQMRRDYLAGLESKLYVESSGHIYGLLDLLDQLFLNSKFIFIIRDPREWVRSALNTFEYILYGPLDPSFFNLSIKASDFKDDPHYHRWSKMSKFEKYCWYYNKLNTFVFERMAERDNCKVIQHERMFGTQTRHQVFQELLSFATTYPDYCELEFDYRPKMLEQKVHSNANEGFPHWREWSDQQVEILKRHCGQWMERFDYGTEAEWN
ncbi:MAG: sulfotransferase [Bacillota bacterium]